MLDIPTIAVVLFIAITLLTVAVLLYALKKILNFKQVLIVAVSLLAWAMLQAGLSLTHFYLAFASMPPRFFFAVIPPLFTLILIFLLPSKKLVLQLPLKALTLLHVVRIPVELFLWWLHKEGYVPRLMTFEGGNPDILSGITAIAVFIWAFRGEFKPRLLLIWNAITLMLLLNIVLRAALTVPYATQQFAFDQPNLAVLYFPFIWLPSIIVPIVLFCHVASIWQLLSRTSPSSTFKAKAI